MLDSCLRKIGIGPGLYGKSVLYLLIDITESSDHSKGLLGLESTYSKIATLVKELLEPTYDFSYQFTPT